MCSLGLFPSSMIIFPPSQTEQDFEPLLDAYFPASQTVQALVSLSVFELVRYFPSTQILHEKLSGVEGPEYLPVSQDVQAWDALAVEECVRYFPAPQAVQVVDAEPEKLPAPQTLQAVASTSVIDETRYFPDKHATQRVE